MLEAIFNPIRNAIAVWGAKKADEKIDGRIPGENVLQQAIKTLGEKKGRELVEGPLSNFLREVLEGMNADNPDFLADNTQWNVNLKLKKNRR